MLFFLTHAAFAVDTDPYDPAGSNLDGQGGLQVESPKIGTSGAFYAGANIVYAHNPVVVGSGPDMESFVSDQFGLRLGGGYTLGRWVRFDIDIPMYPVIAAPGADYEGGAFGDIRIGGLIPVLREEDSPIGLSFKPFFALPTASEEGLVGAGGCSAGVLAIAERRLGDNLVASANVGTTIAPPSTLGAYEFGSTFNLGLGLGYLYTEQLRFGAEINGDFGLEGGEGAYNKNPVELDVYGSYTHDSGFLGTVGMGTGLVAGVGSPDFRLVLAAGYRKGAPPDKDNDGVEDKLDACKERPEDVDNYKDSDGCPDPDNDGDGILDADDKCTETPEDTDGFEDRDGCPETDNDKDGLADGDDNCPTEFGPEATLGCPDKDGDRVADRDDMCPTVVGPAKSAGCPDQDGDLVIDIKDKCPTEPRDPREDPTRSDGCPHRVIVTAQRIEMNETVFFDTGKTSIQKQSYGLLDEVAAVILKNPQIKMIEVCGHTDSDGDDKKNLVLSQGRGEAVAVYLTGKGVDRARLTSIGYGEGRPLDTNQTAVGKAKNRRVELVIK